MLHIIVIVIGVICLLLSAFGVVLGRVDLYRLGWAFLALSLVV